ncbi:MAG: HAMP domain-containing histidine kinase, partial [Eggerthellaceae bacterium]|nr:HAMP domain-containing histidine kinase [Eggerthellaceae bacterium]
VEPIHRLTQAAERIREGKLETRVEMEGNDEIAHLGSVFDRMAEAVESDKKLERRLTSDVAHELRTPLMAIQSTVEAMMDGVFEKDNEHLNTILNETQRLCRLVDARLDLSRLENRATVFKDNILDYTHIVSEKAQFLGLLAEQKKLRLDLNAQPEIYIKGDADLIGRVIDNLVTNAFRYTPEGGVVTMSVYAEGAWACLEVADTGIGLSPEEAKMVFRRFWRSDEGRARASGGLGVGLAIVKEIVDRYHGSVRVSSEKGQGATFIVRLPRYGSPTEKK